MNSTWVSPIHPVDMPSPEELFGDFYDPEMDRRGGVAFERTLSG
jgi:sulfoacetaldehyde dehydrogenase